MSIIKVENLVKKYKKATNNAVDNISFNVNKGEFFALLGPNGAGKTTTISVLNTTLAKTSGNVQIANFDTDKQSSAVRQNIGVIFQNPSLDANLTAEENIRLHTNLYGLYSYRPFYKVMPQEYKNKVDELASVLDLKTDELFKPIKTFSGGMKRKLEIIRGLMHSPKVLFLDEPTTGLDPVSRKNLWEYLQRVRREKEITIFLTTHYLDEAEGADTVCVINHGKIVSFGPPAELKAKLVDQFLIIESKDKNSLLNELKDLNIKTVSTDPVKIDIVDSKHAQEILQKIRTELNMIKIVSPTLEEAYISLINNNNE
jgi:ABC-2 type transport system ATP-binding protein